MARTEQPINGLREAAAGALETRSLSLSAYGVLTTTRAIELGVGATFSADPIQLQVIKHVHNKDTQIVAPVLRRRRHYRGQRRHALGRQCESRVSDFHINTGFPDPDQQADHRHPE